jgi:tRNA 2-selenouridine synthase
MALWLQMRVAPVALVDIPKDKRVHRLVSEYADIDHGLLVEATERIRKRLGGKVTKDALDALDRHDYATVADLTLDYYDKAYLHGLSQRDATTISLIGTTEDNPSRTAQQLVEWAKSVQR